MAGGAGAAGAGAGAGAAGAGAAGASAAGAGATGGIAGAAKKIAPLAGGLKQNAARAAQQKAQQEQRAREMARQNASTGQSVFAKSWFQIFKDNQREINYDEPKTLSTALVPGTMCQFCKEEEAQYEAGYASPLRPLSPEKYNFCERCFDIYGTGGALGTYSKFVKSEIAKERKTPEAMRHKREYDAKYNKRPEQVKYREELNQERRRRGIMGSHNHMDVSHTQGNKLTLEPEHSNRARHFKDKGTLRVVKSLKDDIEMLRNIIRGPMDEQDSKIMEATLGMMEERAEEELDTEDEISPSMFGGGSVFV